MKVLIIDDNSEWLASVSRYFRNHQNVVVAECHTADEAIDAIKNNKPDLVLLDNDLSDERNDGMVVVDYFNGEIKIISTTTNDIAKKWYAERRFGWVDKRDLREIKKLVEAE